MSREDTTNKKGKPHRDRKNPHAAEEFQKQRHERNVARGKQIWVPDVYLPADHPVNSAHVPVQSTSGHWEREAA